MKKFWLLLIVFIALTSPALAFDDITSHWSSNAVDFCVGQGLINGDGGYFKPDNYLTRAEAAAIIDRIYQYKSKSTNNFGDVSNEWFAVSVENVAELKIIDDDNRQNFNPYDNLTRLNASYIIQRAFKLQELPLLAKWDDYITRAEFVALIERYLGGIYADLSGVKTDKNVVVRGESVIKSETNGAISEIQGNVIICSDTPVQISNCSMNGNLVVIGNTSKITVTGNSTINEVIVYSASETCGLEFDKDVVVEKLNIESQNVYIVNNGTIKSCVSTSTNTILGGNKPAEISSNSNAIIILDNSKTTNTGSSGGGTSSYSSVSTSASPSPSPSPSPSDEPSPSPSLSPSVEPSPTHSPAVEPSPSVSSSPSVSVSPSLSPSPSPSPSSTVEPSPSPTPSPTAEPSPTPSPSPTPIHTHSFSDWSDWFLVDDVPTRTRECQDNDCDEVETETTDWKVIETPISIEEVDEIYLNNITSLPDGYNNSFVWLDTSTPLTDTGIDGKYFGLKYYEDDGTAMYYKVLIIFHRHIYNKEIITKVPTCTETGTKTWQCDCGAVSDNEEIPALGHNFDEWAVSVAATHIKEGTQIRTCKRNSEHTESQAIPKLSEHTYDDWKTIMPAGYMELGVERGTCECRDTTERPIHTVTHTMNTEIVDPICMQGGYTYDYCVCGYETQQRDLTSALGHSYTNWSDWSANEGVHIRTRECERCGVELTESHSENYVYTYEDNYNGTHKKHGICQDCKENCEFQTEENEEHIDDDNDGVCDYCEAEIGQAEAEISFGNYDAKTNVGCDYEWTSNIDTITISEDKIIFSGAVSDPPYGYFVQLLYDDEIDGYDTNDFVLQDWAELKQDGNNLVADIEFINEYIDSGIVVWIRGVNGNNWARETYYSNNDGGFSIAVINMENGSPIACGVIN